MGLTFTEAELETVLNTREVDAAAVAQRLHRPPGVVADFRRGLHAFHAGFEPWPRVALAGSLRRNLDVRPGGWICPWCGSACGAQDTQVQEML
jgi:hypothetical protein